MNETVTIKEGGLTRRLAPIDKLKVNTTDNKDSMWVPTGKANTGVLHASENGIYIASEDGYEAYSEVIVRVTKDSFDGDTSFDDWDYETPDMDLDNWDPETIEEFENDPEAFDDIFNNEDEWKDIDKPIDIKMDNPKIQDTKISGIDPVTGNEMEVGLDADGYLTEFTLPSSIKIEVSPDKHQYVDGQPILFRGMVVKAYTADGELWTDESHPDGVIPHGELTFPITIAKLESETEYTEYQTDGSISGTKINHVSLSAPTGDGLEIGRNGEEWGIIETYNEVIRVGIVNNNYVYASLREGLTVWIGFRSSKSGGSGRGYPLTPIIINDKTAYVATGNYPTFEEWENNHGIIPENSVTTDPNYQQIGWEMLYGSIKTSGTQTVPVQYIRSDGEVLEDSFTIEVLPDPDGAHPQVDPSTVEWNHRKYKANEDLGAVEVRHGSVYMEGGAIYDVGAAVRLGMLEPVDNEIVP